jgi:hypothetical protein
VRSLQTISLCRFRSFAGRHSFEYIVAGAAPPLLSEVPRRGATPSGSQLLKHGIGADPDKLMLIICMQRARETNRWQRQMAAETTQAGPVYG